MQRNSGKGMPYPNAVHGWHLDARRFAAPRTPFYAVTIFC